MGKRWNLKQERAAIEERARSLRERYDALLGKLTKLDEQYETALLAGDVKKAEAIEHIIEKTKGELTEFNRAISGNTEANDKSAHIQLQDNSKWNNTANTWMTAGGIVTGAGLTYLGLRSAYDADTSGNLINKGVLNFVKGLNPFSLLKKH